MDSGDVTVVAGLAYKPEEVVVDTPIVVDIVVPPIVVAEVVVDNEHKMYRCGSGIVVFPKSYS